MTQDASDWSETCPKEMEQVRQDRVQRLVEIWGDPAVGDAWAMSDLDSAPEENVFVRYVAQRSRINRGCHVIPRFVQSVEQK